jgi:hypothetical protein
MAIKLIANYSKRLGLPGFSSHQFSVSVETELVATDDIATESRRLYEMLQSNVDEQIEQTGFVPPHDYGMGEPVTNQGRNGNGSAPHSNAPLNGGRWRCSEKQYELIQKLIAERNLDVDELERTAIDLFGHGLSQMDKAQASGLLDSLMANRRLGERRRHTTPGNRPYVGDGRRGQ